MKLGIKLEFKYTGNDKEAYRSELRVFKGEREVKDDKKIHFTSIFDGLKINDVCELVRQYDEDNDPYFCIKTEAGVYPLKKENDKKFYFKVGGSYRYISKTPTLEEFNDFCEQIEELKELIEKKLEELTKNSINITKEF